MSERTTLGRVLLGEKEITIPAEIDTMQALARKIIDEIDAAASAAKTPADDRGS